MQVFICVNVVFGVEGVKVKGMINIKIVICVYTPS
jgi:hypothetical protein